MSTEAPTSNATIEKLNDQFKGLTEDELDFVNCLHQHYGIVGKLPTLEECVTDYFYTEAEYEAFMASKQVTAALIERDLIKRPELEVTKKGKYVGPPVGDKGKRLEKQLTPRQLMVANVMLDLIDARSDKKKLQDLQVSTQTYQRWLADPVFSGYLRERTESFIGNIQHEALLALADKVKAGDTKAIQLYLEFTGRFTSNSGGVNVNVGTGGTKADFKSVLLNILEIIQEEVTDKETIIRISERFKNMMNMQSVANQLLNTNEEIVMPQIAQNRELNPKLKELMNKGEGYE